MTHPLWHSGVRREHYPLNGPVVIERFGPRPWPADPKAYPLSGPSAGPVYCPPPTFGRGGRGDVVGSILCLALGALLVGMVACAHTGASYVLVHWPR